MRDRFGADLRGALALDMAYPERQQLTGGRPAAVLILFGWNARGEGPCVLITQRTDSVATHKGQMAFPGGACESHERDTFWGRAQAALRETEEEVGIPPAQVDVMGALPELTTITSFRVTPVVGLLKVPIEDQALRINPQEIARTLWIPLEALRAQGVYQLELREFRGVEYPIHAFQVGEDRIWGATGSMLKNLLDRLLNLG